MYEYILDRLPYKSSFRFVDRILSLDENGVTGEYSLREDAFFYEDHFVGNPVTPGVIITEIMAQIGLVVLGIHYIMDRQETQGNPGTAGKSGISGQTGMPTDTIYPLLTSTEVSFYKMALPGQKLTVISKKEYFRFGKLKCYVEMLGEDKELIARGTFAGVIRSGNSTKRK